MGNERQKHGFAFEDDLSTNVDVLNLSGNYTSAEDGNVSNISISIKTRSERGQLCMASASNCVNNDEPTLLITGTYASGKKNTGKYKTIDVMYLEHGTSELFGSKTAEMKKFVNEYSSYMSGVDFDYTGYAYTPELGEFCSKATTRYWQVDRNKFKEHYAKLCEHSDTDVFMKLAPKRQTSRIQRRLQSAIPKSSFFEMREAFPTITLENFNFQNANDVTRLNDGIRSFIH